MVSYYKIKLGCDYNIESLRCVNKSATEAPPSPALDLTSIDLSHNLMENIPDDIYGDQATLIR